MSPIRKTKNKSITSLNDSYSLPENSKRKMYLCKNEMLSMKSGSGDVIEPFKQESYQTISKEFEIFHQEEEKQKLDRATGIGKSSTDIVMRSFSSQSANR